jgi:hypothetical protein
VWRIADFPQNQQFATALAIRLYYFNRIWRDARVAGLHATLVPSTVYELYGRLMCGLDAWG